MTFKVAEKRCDQCLFSSAKIVDDERAEEVLEDCERQDSYFVCHKFTIAGKEACCRGFYDRNPSACNLMRMATHLGVVEFVPLPKEDSD